MNNYVVDQGYSKYTDEDHKIWSILHTKQGEILKNRASPEFLQGIEDMKLSPNHIPNFKELSNILQARTGWSIVPVPGIIPGYDFFCHLANKRFPAANWIRSKDQLEYLEEADLFHDIYGHVPLLTNPFFTDFMQTYGQKGLKAKDQGSLPFLAHLYWYTVEFGLIQTQNGLRISGSGIISSSGESVYSLESNEPNRIKFNLKRIMRTNYKIDTYQAVYFVINSYEQLFKEVNQDLMPIYKNLKGKDFYMPEILLDEDEIVNI